MAAFTEQPMVFPCAGERLVGIVTRPARESRLGVVIVTGGPQYRAGSHRQFVHLARHLAGAGLACVRFDQRGSGDSTGTPVGFLNAGPDIAAAVNALFAAAPGLEGVALWGLCDGATAAALYAPTDRRVRALCLANPWVRSPAGEASAWLQHYYLRRLTDAGFWRKLRAGEVAVGAALQDFARTLKQARGAAAPACREGPGSVEAGAARSAIEGGTTVDAPSGADDSPPLVPRVAAALTAFDGSLQVLLSGRDLVAAEFAAAMASDRRLRRRLGRPDVRVERFDAADHTFSSAAFRRQLAEAVGDFLLRAVATPASACGGSARTHGA